MCCPADAPTDDISGEHVDDERHINEPGPCRDIGKIRDPQPVGSWRLELAIDPIERAWSALVADGRALWLAADDALQAEVTHEPGRNRPTPCAGSRGPGGVHAPRAPGL